MNVCYIASNTSIPSRQANSVHVMKMCNAYAGLGHEVTLVLPDRGEAIESSGEDVFEFYGIPVSFKIRKVPVSRWRRLDFFQHAILMPLAAMSKKPVLVHSRGLTAAWGLTKLFQTPTIFETHQPISQNGRMQKMFNQLINSPHLRAFVLITHALVKHMRPFLPETTRLLVAPDGVDASWLQQSMSTREARAKLGLQDEKRRIVVYTGHLYRGRGLELVTELALRMPDHLFMIVGGCESDITHYRHQAGHLNNFHLAGFKPPAQVLTYLQAADVLLMPYAHKVEVPGGADTASFCSPMKMFEYMAAGRPILSSTLPVLREILQDGVNCLFLPYDEPQRWTEALCRLQRDGKLANELGCQARRDVQQYTWEKRAQEILERIDIKKIE